MDPGYDNSSAPPSLLTILSGKTELHLMFQMIENRDWVMGMNRRAVPDEPPLRSPGVANLMGMKLSTHGRLNFGSVFTSWMVGKS